LNELCKYARQQTTGDTEVLCVSSGSPRDGFAIGAYWSSSEGNPANTWHQYFSWGVQDISNKAGDASRVRPVRAF